MPVSGHNRANDESRAEIDEVAVQLTPDDLDRTAESEWTVAMLFGHLAFWDRFLLVRWQTALAAGRDEPEQVPDGLADLLNGALEPILAALAGAAAVAQAASAAASLDALIAALPERSVQAASAAGHVRLLDRSLHRREHLAQIRAALSDS